MEVMQNTAHGEYAVITGASSGIGRELAKQFAKAKFRLIVAAEDVGLDDAATELRGLGASVETCRTDLSKPEGVEALVSAIGDRYVDALVLNAGVGINGAFDETPLDRELEIVDLNCRSVVHLAKRVIPAMVERGKGRVLITSSIAAVQAGPFEAVYSASKAFDKAFAAALRDELREKGVTVTTMMPGPTDTNFFARADMLDTKAGSGDGERADVTEVAEQGFDALMSGKGEFFAGPLKIKIQGRVSQMLPESVAAAAHRGLAEPGTAQK
jgi:short-subunit dehydrogenase